MASGSIFILVRKQPQGSVKRSQLRAALGTKDKLPDMPRYVRLSKYQYADSKQRCKLDVLFKSHFISDLNVLREHLNLTPYSNDPDKCFYALSYAELKRMWQAAHYLLYSDYSRKTEQLLDSEYIEVLSSLSQDYTAWDSKQQLEYGYSLGKNILIRLQRVLQAVITITNEDQHPEDLVLLYEVW